MGPPEPAEVSDLYVLELATNAAEWLSRRQAIIAGNVANASTPGYRSKDLPEFAASLDRSEVTMAATNPAHMGISGISASSGRTIDAAAPEETISGNSVDVENEMMKLGDTARTHTFDLNIKRSINQMLLSVLK
jgi:flagellar basal-body rod protein FlgB